MSKDNPVRYLGFFQSPDGDWEHMVRRVLEETRNTCDKLERHPLVTGNCDLDFQTTGSADSVVNAGAY